MNKNLEQCGGEIHKEEFPDSSRPESSHSGNYRKFWFCAAIASVTLIILSGIALRHFDFNVFDISWDELTGKPAAMINDEKISRGDLRARLKSARKMLEQQY